MSTYTAKQQADSADIVGHLAKATRELTEAYLALKAIGSPYQKEYLRNLYKMQDEITRRMDIIAGETTERER